LGRYSSSSEFFVFLGRNRLAVGQIADEAEEVTGTGGTFGGPYALVALELCCRDSLFARRRWSGELVDSLGYQPS
jgi:hypothetical protein